MRRNFLVLAAMVAALALMISAGVMNYLQRRRAEEARVQAIKMQLVPDNGQSTAAAEPAPAADAQPGDDGYVSPLQGKQAPAFTLEDLTGKRVSLSSYKGRPLVVDFWATWCGPCKVEIPWFEKLHDQYAGQGLEILGVSTDDLDRDDPAKLFTEKRDISDFVAKMHMNYPILLGSDSLEDLYSVDAMPTTLFIDRNGKIVASTVGLAPRDEIEADIKKAIAGAQS
ncbi:MAG TPA: TlpA disulfide reductase family protein [Acidobacteriaceae bacterium]|nr:TlpA disulfide reductase family protein [Acidobacteriaceae bacterium]